MLDMFECESLRVCMNGTLRVGEVRGSSAREPRFGVEVAVVVWLVALSSREDLLRL